MAVWYRRAEWNRECQTVDKMESIRAWYREFGGLDSVLAALDSNFSSASLRQEWLVAGMVRETSEEYDDISF